MYDYHQKNWFARHKLSVFFIVVVMAAAGYFVLGQRSKQNPNPYVLENNQSSDQPTQSKDTEKPAETAKIGQVSKDGSFEFTVKGIKCGEKTMGTNEYAHDDATGIFCRLQLSVKNTGESAQSFPAVLMKLTTNDGKAHEPDSQATLYTQEDLTKNIWYENVAAGATVTGDVVFDIPVDANPEKIHIYGAEGSTGDIVSLE